MYRRLVVTLEKMIKNEHNKACDEKKSYYIDPETGFSVFTEYFLKERGYCCSSGCRHCPYGFNEKN